jgi:hypothetical protein
MAIIIRTLCLALYLLLDYDNNNQFSLIDLSYLKGLKIACLNINSLWKQSIYESKINESVSDDEISVSGFHLIRKGDSCRRSIDVQVTDICMYNESECFTGISEHEKTMYENTSAKRECFHNHTLFSRVWISRWDTSSSYLYGFSNESRPNRMFSFADLNRILNQA